MAGRTIRAVWAVIMVGPQRRGLRRRCWTRFRWSSLGAGVMVGKALQGEERGWGWDRQRGWIVRWLVCTRCRYCMLGHRSSKGTKRDISATMAYDEKGQERPRQSTRTIRKFGPSGPHVSLRPLHRVLQRWTVGPGQHRASMVCRISIHRRGRSCRCPVWRESVWTRRRSRI